MVVDVTTFLPDGQVGGGMGQGPGAQKLGVAKCFVNALGEGRLLESIARVLAAGM